MKNQNPPKKSLLASDRIDHYRQLYPSFSSPFDFLVLTMNGLNPDGSVLEVGLKEKIECAKAAVPYTNPKLAQTELIQEAPQELTEAEKLSRFTELMKNPELQKLLLGEPKNV